MGLVLASATRRNAFGPMKVLNPKVTGVSRAAA
jgi:hypothetical protein